LGRRESFAVRFSLAVPRYPAMWPTFSSREASRISTRSWSPWEPSNTQRSSRICWPFAATTSRGNRLPLPMVTYVCFLCDQAVSCLLRVDSSVSISATEHLCLLSRAIRNIILLAITLYFGVVNLAFPANPGSYDLDEVGWTKLTDLQILCFLLTFRISSCTQHVMGILPEFLLRTLSGDSFGKYSNDMFLMAT